jgi:hypothetical protein
MKQYTTPEQTAKLIELGFDKPKQFIEGPTLLDSRFAYSIGELIEMLPITRIEFDLKVWVDIPIAGGASAEELIDALFEACVKLKEEGVI